MAGNPVTQPETKSPRDGRAAWLSRLAWASCGILATLSLANLALDIAGWRGDTRWIDVANELVFILIPIGYALMAALIASRQPRNTIAWLLMTIAVAFVLIRPVDRFLKSFPSVPDPAPLTLVVVWLQNWSWLLFIVPLFLVLLLFPTGRPPSPRLRWVPYFAAGFVILFALTAAFAETLSPSFYADWNLPNPIGLIPASASWLLAPIMAGLALVVVICPASLFYRYRRAGAIERAQIKWLLYTSAVFVAVYLPWTVLHDIAPAWLTDVVDLLVFLVFYFFPVAIAIAILRYRLWDIDVLIRKSLVYAALTGTLGVVYFGATTLFQKAFAALTGTEGSTLAIVLSTLVIAAMFSPLRRRIQRDIDRRFFRKKYDAEQTLQQFALGVRDQAELEQLSQRLLAVVQETMQPEGASLWLKTTTDRRQIQSAMDRHGLG